MTQELLDAISGILPNGTAPLDGVIAAGQLTAAHIPRLKEAGIKTVVDLRASDEPRGFDEAAAVRLAGLAYHSVPVVQGQLGHAEFDKVRGLLCDTRQRPIVLHCASANRAGALLIPYLILDEKRSPDDALRIAREVGLRSEPLARAALDYVHDVEHASAKR